MTTSVLQFSDEVASHGVRERGFTLERAGRRIPGVLWVPEGAAEPGPLVLLGHGGSGNKREGYIVWVARRLVRHFGYRAVAIDGPIHGDRRPDPDADPQVPFMDFGQLWSNDPTMTDEMIADWRAVLDAVQGLEEVGESLVGYWGLSMGTILGLPLVAAEPRIQAAVLGLMGIVGPTKERIAKDAASLRRPVMFLLQWNDELFARQYGFDLFDAIGSADKQLLCSPGGHVEVTREEFDLTLGFLQHRFAAIEAG